MAHTSPPSVLVLACDGHRDDGEDLARLGELVEQLLAGAAVSPGTPVCCRVVRDLCSDGRVLAKASRRTPGDVVVVSPCRKHRDRRAPARELRETVESSRVPRVRVSVTDPDDIGSTTDGTGPTDAATDDTRTRLHAIALVAAALAAPQLAAGLTPSEPASDGVSRRSLLTGRLRSARALPELTADPCTVAPGCQLCVEACTRGALSMDGGVPSVDPRACDGCGACVAACPTETIGLGSFSRRHWEFYLATLLITARELGQPLGIHWACRDARPAPAPAGDIGWLRLRLPCLRALTPGWLLQPLASGASGVAVSACAACADVWAADRPRPQLMRQLLGAPGHDESTSLWWARPASASPVPNSPTQPPVILREPIATADAVVRLDCLGAESVESSGAPLGVVDCTAERCTACGLCVQWCPTHALAIDQQHDAWTLRFSPAGCAGCGACVAACPEQALNVRRGVDPVGLRQGEHPLAEIAVSRCARCHEALPSPVLLARMAAAGVPVTDDGLCGDCRLRTRDTHVASTRRG